MAFKPEVLPAGGSRAIGGVIAENANFVKPLAQRSPEDLSRRALMAQALVKQRRQITVRKGLRVLLGQQLAELVHLGQFGDDIGLGAGGITTGGHRRG